jgi:hypothetical protein
LPSCSLARPSARPFAAAGFSSSKTLRPFLTRPVYTGGSVPFMARTLNLDIQRRTASRRRSLRFTQRRRHVRQQDASRVFPSGSVLAPIRRLRPADAGTRSGQVKAIEIARILQRTLLAPAYTQFRRLSQPTRCRISENVFLFVSRRPPQGDDLRKNDTLCLALYPKPYSLRPTSFTLDTETAALGAPS